MACWSRAVSTVPDDGRRHEYYDPLTQGFKTVTPEAAQAIAQDLVARQQGTGASASLPQANGVDVPIDAPLMLRFGQPA